MQHPRSGMKFGAALLALAGAFAGAEVLLNRMVAVEAQGASMPTFQHDTSWPKLPDGQIPGPIPGVAVDAQDHVWAIARHQNITNNQKGVTLNPPTSDCCLPMKPVMEFDSAGNLLQQWGGLANGYEWPANEHSIHVDYKGNVWVSGNGGVKREGKQDNQILKFTRDGKFLMQIGKQGASIEGNSNDTRNMNQPTEMYVYQKTNEVFVADGYTNRRVIVFDADTGAYKRHWGAYGNRPDDTACGGWGGKPCDRARMLEGAGPQQFALVHGVRISKDDLVYVADREGNRVQIFSPDGKFVKEFFIARKTLAGVGTAFSVGLSPDPQQQFMYVPDYGNNKVWVLNRQSGAILSSVGRPGPLPGQFVEAHSIDVDSKGNLYVGDNAPWRFVQKFTFKGVSKSSQ